MPASPTSKKHHLSDDNDYRVTMEMPLVSDLLIGFVHVVYLSSSSLTSFIPVSAAVIRYAKLNYTIVWLISLNIF